MGSGRPACAPGRPSQTRRPPGPRARRRTAMPRFTRLGPLALGAILVAAGTVPAEERPHTMSGTGQFVSATDFVSEGIATHLGRFHEAGSVQFSPTESPTVFQIDGWAIHTAANGDQVYELISGQLDLLTGAGTATAKIGRASCRER